MKRFFTLIFVFFILSSTKTYAASTQVTPDASQNDNLLTANTNPKATLRFGAANTGSWTDIIGAKYIPENSHYLCQIDLEVSKNGTPTDSIQAQIYQGGSNLTNGSLLGTSANTWLGSDLGITTQVVSFWFGSTTVPGNCIGIVKGTTYWISVSRTGALNDTNNYNFEFQSSPAVPTSATWLGWSKIFGQVTGTITVPTVNLWGINNGSALESIPTAVQSFCQNFGLLTETCNVFGSLFVPSQSVFSSNYTTVKNNLNSKAPFAYINTVFALNLSNTGSATSTPAISIPITHTSYISSNLPTHMDSNFGATLDSIKNSTRGVFAILLWLAFVFYIIRLASRVI